MTKIIISICELSFFSKLMQIHEHNHILRYEWIFQLRPVYKVRLVLTYILVLGHLQNQLLLNNV